MKADKPILARGAFWNYDGYLAPYRPLIAAMILAGQSYKTIGRMLFAAGVRSNVYMDNVGRYGRKLSDELDATDVMAALLRHLDRHWSSPDYAAFWPRRKGGGQTLVSTPAPTSGDWVAYIGGGD